LAKNWLVRLPIGSLDADRERDACWNELAARQDADPTTLVSGPEALARIRDSLRL
jgi:hypothetical protein